ncbi:hypothetical protein PAHAL_5G394300 [Panicum hallii]|uniref:Uncharacterized protein n=1 Tax=Panicum hallii TaxID=206008 RepID=A0A2S3HVV0_9POAL|nr:hypothetical protein PAHAL_5G394300 [Panicum hallii]
MAGYLAGALIPVLLVVHLLDAQASARHAPASSSSAPAVEIMYTAPTNDGPSPATGHGNQPSPRTAQDGAINGEPSVTAASETRATFSPSPSHCNHSHPPSADESQINAGGVGEASGARP